MNIETRRFIYYMIGISGYALGFFRELEKYKAIQQHTWVDYIIIFIYGIGISYSFRQINKTL